MILAYAVATAATAAIPEGLQVLTRGSLRCYYRERQETPPQASESEVREFFTTNQSLFAQVDILEFRFPTVVHSVNELEEFLARHEQGIVSDLDRLSGLAQLAVYLPKSSSAAAPSQSGTEYLQKKHQQMRNKVSAIDAIRAIAGADLQDSSVQGNRILLLLPRRIAPDAIGKIKAGSGFEVAGPFPPSGFAKLLS